MDAILYTSNPPQGRRLTASLGLAVGRLVEAGPPDLEWWISPEPALIGAIAASEAPILVVACAPLLRAPLALVVTELLVTSRGGTLHCLPRATDPAIDLVRRSAAACRPAAAEELVILWARSGRSVRWIAERLAQLEARGALARAPSVATVGRWVRKSRNDGDSG